jgi:hypothetical protein
MKWVFNPLMLWGAALGFLISMSVGILEDAWNHEGSGYVTYGDGDWTELVSESRYKRHNFTSGGMMLVIGVTLWIGVAYIAKEGQKNSNR